ncbi:YsnF/AvaK domain-containing protein [Curtobacterium sp. MCBD17_021]|uniref:YsnF/AvaK domain-containing protein n=1 Tax=Curtobacterium sp. MCBD17_021 TaxID=2175665 RepID=UPI000DAAC580|nr:YsnF/AvaK domain-containing protein [Curtobacterium sp. MCBD17_021]PZE64539.1 hypothetical protein DEI83_11650 [Curtobacterium sp. MCBD17_021]
MTSPHTPRRPSAADDEIEVVRHEERLAVRTELHATERVRLERVVVTEQRTISVDVSHEEVRLTREPITGGTRLPGAEVPVREPIVVVLHEEQVTVTKTVVPVERVTLSTHRVSDDHVVTETLGHEEVDVTAE